jgi:tungstate transport system substrate-binding protein
MMSFRSALALIVTIAAINATSAEPQSVILASTTSVEASGLLANILPQFTAKAGITVNVVAQGTGKALDTARRGDADLLLVHDPEAEQQFMDEGHGSTRRQIHGMTLSSLGRPPIPLMSRAAATASPH